MPERPAERAHLFERTVDIQKRPAQESSSPGASRRRETAIDLPALDALLDDYLLRGLNIACLAGSRVNNPQDADLLRRLAEKYHLPVATTLAGKGAFPEGHPLALGLYGFAGHTRAVETINAKRSMCCWCWGAILNQRDSLNWHPQLHGTKTLVVIDEDFDQISSHYQPDVQIFSNLSAALQHLLAAADSNEPHLACVNKLRSQWMGHVSQLPLEQRQPDRTARMMAGEKHLYPGEVVEHLRSRTARTPMWWWIPGRTVSLWLTIGKATALAIIIPPARWRRWAGRFAPGSASNWRRRSVTAWW
ncbi:Cyclohexane-1,2-dione hydrolase [Serratia rubidaea]|uniref:Cyclohexane-1,2-dione hydrolase n=1 Tax=Serratia rubidaea TaxID=61652 RepID=A0A4U9HLK8_SERRU|nr:Cyclohexane-1,2-dione hydrolase [Serratia rubidaea]